jgi:hypothetical protein
MEVFGDVIASCGLVLWDGNVPSTANVAATICGLDGYLPVLAESPLHKELVAAGIEVKQSLVGMFQDGKKGQNIVGTSIPSTGSAKNDAYLWALEKYFDRCSSQYVAYTLDGAISLNGYEAYPDNRLYVGVDQSCLKNHDYLIARRCFFFDLAPYKGDAACDDPAQLAGKADKGTDNKTMIKILDRRYERANGAWGQLMGFPPWWAKYTTHKGLGTQGDVWNEWLFNEYITCYNMAKEADAQSPCSMTNGSVYYKYVPHTDQYENNKKSEKITYDDDVFYYTVYVGDYDSSAWLKTHMFEMWYKKGGDKNRGVIPLMWSINPNLSYRVPMVFDYLYENKTENDYFAGGDGGAGYIIPDALFTEKVLSRTGEKRTKPNAGDSFAAYSKVFYDRFDMDITGFLINAENGGINKNIASCVNQYSPIGSFNDGNFHKEKPKVYQGTYYVKCLNQITKTNAKGTMNDRAYRALQNGINFGAFRTIAHTPTEITNNVLQFNEFAEECGVNVRYCDPYTYFDVLAQSGQAVEITK